MYNASLFSVAGSQMTTDHVLHAVTLGACGRCYYQHIVNRGGLHAPAERCRLLMLLITCDSDSRSVRSSDMAAVAASHDEFKLPPAFLGFVIFRPRTIVPRTARTVRPFKIKQMKCEHCRRQLVDHVWSPMRTTPAHTELTTQNVANYA